MFLTFDQLQVGGILKLELGGMGLGPSRTIRQLDLFDQHRPDIRQSRGFDPDLQNSPATAVPVRRPRRSCGFQDPSRSPWRLRFYALYSRSVSIHLVIRTDDN